ncbi:MAG: hypothetical protein Ta2G_09710 [Termitinemataceae bacterium]|nr:MAG: hypothetical protein Ta2G_09710 [Termitinemataceae bacterium]
MRAINICNDKKRDARVALAAFPQRPLTKIVMQDGSEKQNIQFVKTACGLDALLTQCGTLDDIANAIINDNPDIDIETVGRILPARKKIYVRTNGEAAYSFNLTQIIYDITGVEKERRNLTKTAANIASEIPIRWSGKEFAKNECIHKYIFTRNYQLRHTNGLTYDFLFEMAKTLHDHNTLMFVGGGKDGAQPVVLSLGGVPYRGFLEGRVSGEKYCLILHLTNIELKEV